MLLIFPHFFKNIKIWAFEMKITFFFITDLLQKKTCNFFSVVFLFMKKKITKITHRIEIRVKSKRFFFEFGKNWNILRILLCAVDCTDKK